MHILLKKKWIYKGFDQIKSEVGKVMELEKQLCSLEHSKRLNELGVKQNSMFVWQYYDDRCYAAKFLPFALAKPLPDGWKQYAAFSVAELGELLPNEINNEDDDKCLFYYDKYNNCHRISYVEDCQELCSPFIETKGDTEANARAKILIYLIENKLMELNDEKKS